MVTASSCAPTFPAPTPAPATPDSCSTQTAGPAKAHTHTHTLTYTHIHSRTCMESEQAKRFSAAQCRDLPSSLTRRTRDPACLQMWMSATTTCALTAASTPTAPSCATVTRASSWRQTAPPALVSGGERDAASTPKRPEKSMVLSQHLLRPACS